MDIRPELAEWIFEAQLSPIRETFKRVKGDPSIMNLCIGDPYFKVPEIVSHAMVEAVQKGCTHYEDDTGMPALREAIIKSENALRGVSLHLYKNIVISSGGVNAVFSVYQSIVSPGTRCCFLTLYGYRLFRRRKCSFASRFLSRHILKTISFLTGINWKSS